MRVSCGASEVGVAGAWDPEGLASIPDTLPFDAEYLRSRRRARHQERK